MSSRPNNVKLFPSLTIHGAAVSDTEFVGVTTLGALKAVLINPENFDSKDGQKSLKDPIDQNARNFRNTVQRTFTGATKKENLPSYASYIADVREDKIVGCTPAITLFCLPPAECDSDETGVAINALDKHTAVATIHPDARLIAIDGETQTAARFRVSDANKSAWGDVIKVILYYGLDPDMHGSQFFNDLNSLQRPVNKALIAAADRRGVITDSVFSAIKRMPALEGRINRKSDTLSIKPSRANEITTLQRLLAFSVAVVEGDSFFSGGTTNTRLKNLNRKGTLADTNYAKSRVASGISSLIECFQKEMSLRQEYIAFDRPMMIALGALYSKDSCAFERLKGVGLGINAPLASSLNAAVNSARAALHAEVGGKKTVGCELKARIFYEVLADAIQTQVKKAA